MRNQLADQPALLSDGGRGVGGGRQSEGPLLDYPGRIRAAGAHGASGDHRQPFGERGFAASFGTGQDAAGAGTLPALAGAFQQQDQRGSAAPMAADGQSGPAPPPRPPARTRPADPPPT